MRATRRVFLWLTITDSSGIGDMSLLNPIKQDLFRLCWLIDELDDSTYIQSLPLISGATIGQHVRHMLEFYGCILLDMKAGLICYDNRKRDLRIETERTVAFATVEKLVETLEEILIDKKVCVQANYSSQDQDDIFLNSTLFRELAYALDHSIHHQAIVKAGLATMPEVLEKISELGVAPSTVRYRLSVNKTIL